MIPVEQVHAVVISLLQMIPNPLVVLLFNVKWVSVVVARYHIFKLVSFFESQSIEMNNLFENRSAPLVICHQLNKFVEYTLQVRVRFVSYDDVAV